MMAKKEEFGLFVKGAEDNPVLTGSDAALLGRVRLAEYARYGTEAVVADAKAKEKDLFPEEAPVVDSGLQVRKGELLTEMTKEKTDELLRDEVEEEAEKAASEAVKAMQDAQDAAEEAAEAEAEAEEEAADEAEDEATAKAEAPAEAEKPAAPAKAGSSK